MAPIRSETLIALALEFYGYELPPSRAQQAAAGADAMLAGARALDALGLTGVEPPFGYPTLSAEAARIRKP